MIELSHCPNCNSNIKKGLISSNNLLEEFKTEMINKFLNKRSKAYCDSCGLNLYLESKARLDSEKKLLNNLLKELIQSIPVITMHNPTNWEYEILEMVTGQSSTGTGVMTEMTSTLSDIFGQQSQRHNQKIKFGEDLCLTQLRQKTIELGGNAIIATDIDYSEIGAARGILMICMSGTAIKLKNLEILGKSKLENLNKIDTTIKTLNDLDKYPIEQL